MCNEAEGHREESGGCNERVADEDALGRRRTCRCDTSIKIRSRWRVSGGASESEMLISAHIAYSRASSHAITARDCSIGVTNRHIAPIAQF